MTENLIAGIAMGVRKPFKTGDVIETDDVFGSIHSINLRNTLIESFYGQLILVPNKVLFRNILKNYTTLGVRRIEVPVGISYGDDIEKAKDVIVDKINEFDFVIRKDETAVYAEGFGDSSINLLVWFWIKYPGEPDFMTVRHKGVVAVKQALDEADISIPFPIRTLDFGIKGGEKLDAMISDKISQQSSVRVRHIGKRTLTSDGDERSEPLTVVNSAISYEQTHWKVNFELLNLFNSTDHDIDYYYASRLPGESAQGVEDNHFHPIEPRTARLTLSLLF